MAKMTMRVSAPLIAGASYGGYATLMGLVKDPDLYKCGINWVGVTDIEMMYTVHWSDFSSVYKRHGMPVMVGDELRSVVAAALVAPERKAGAIAMMFGTQRR